MGHTQRRNSNTCQEPGPTEMSDGMRSTNICQKPFILSCLVLSSLLFRLLFSLSLCLLNLSSFSASVSVCGVVCAVWCGTLKNPVCRLKTLSVCTFKNVPVYAGTTRTCWKAKINSKCNNVKISYLFARCFLRSSGGCCGDGAGRGNAGSPSGDWRICGTGLFVASGSCQEGTLFRAGAARLLHHRSQEMVIADTLQRAISSFYGILSNVLATMEFGLELVRIQSQRRRV